MRDFNADSTNTRAGDFCQPYNLKHLFKTPTCYKNPVDPSPVDFIFTNFKLKGTIITTLIKKQLQIVC